MSGGLCHSIENSRETSIRGMGTRSWTPLVHPRRAAHVGRPVSRYPRYRTTSMGVSGETS